MSGSFRLIDTADEDAGYVPDLTFQNGQEAATYAKDIRSTGRVLRVVREVSDREVWAGADREHTRMHDGTYVPLPEWVPYTFCDGGALTYPHWSTDKAKADDGWIAYSPTKLHLATDRQVTLPFTRYLAKVAPSMSGDEISRMSARLMLTRAPVTLHYTRDAATVRKAYIGQKHCAESSNYPSCMRYDAGEFGLPDGMHPVDAYVGPDSTLTLAYTTRADDSIAARAIVATQRRKFYVRVYGDAETDKRALIDLLEEAGFERRDGYGGERLHLTEHPRRSNCVIVPYVDGDAQSCDEEGNISDDGEIDCETTSGYQSAGPRFACDHCGDRCDEDETTYVQGETWCQSCADNETVYCEFHGETVIGTERVEVMSRRGWTQVWSREAADDNAFHCEHTDAWYDSRYYTEIEVRVTGGTETWCRERTEGGWREDDDGDFLSCDDFPADDDDGDDDTTTPAVATTPADVPATSPRGFQVGDRVRITGRDNYSFADEAHGRLASVTEVRPHYIGVRFARLSPGMRGSREWNYSPDVLTLEAPPAPQPPARPIQAGDTVRVLTTGGDLGHGWNAGQVVTVRSVRPGNPGDTRHYRNGTATLDGPPHRHGTHSQTVPLSEVRLVDPATRI